MKRRNLNQFSLFSGGETGCRWIQGTERRMRFHLIPRPNFNHDTSTDLFPGWSQEKRYSATRCSLVMVNRSRQWNQGHLRMRDHRRRL